MKTSASKFKTVKAYFASQPAGVRTIFEEFRGIILEIAPGAEELISYNMPAFKMDGILVWYAAYKNHIGFYPKPNAIKAFEQELKSYKTSKGAIQFPLDSPIPVGLVKKIVRFRIRENKEEMALKKK